MKLKKKECSKENNIAIKTKHEKLVQNKQSMHNNNHIDIISLLTESQS
jgi:hypothetical protein